MSTPIYLSAQEAAAELGVRPATLYAYVSRGLIRSMPGPGKQRRYDAGDVRRLHGRREPESMAGTRPLSGDTVLETKLTMLTDAGPVYKGLSAIDLARSSTLEAVATLLWDCENDPFEGTIPAGSPIAVEGLGPIERLMAAYATWPLQDRAAFTLSPRLLRQKGAALLRYGVAVLLMRQPASTPLHRQLGEAWQVEGSALEVLRAALVLAADHELNTSAFATRCAASTRAPLHAALISGLGAFSGPRHGSASDRVRVWLADIDEDEDIERLLNNRLARGDDLPGFGHSVYTGADPRADCLLQILTETAGDAPLVKRLPQIIETGESLYGVRPNIDFALAAAQCALGLPDDAGKILFCAGRIVGWIAHALEQYEAPEQIRPRATYVGVRPGGSL
jgi:citrate synthase